MDISFLCKDEFNIYSCNNVKFSKKCFFKLKTNFRKKCLEYLDGMAGYQEQGGSLIRDFGEDDFGKLNQKGRLYL
jgi:hypothetical protein